MNLGTHVLAPGGLDKSFIGLTLHCHIIYTPLYREKLSQRQQMFYKTYIHESQHEFYHWLQWEKGMSLKHNSQGRKMKTLFYGSLVRHLPALWFWAWARATILFTHLFQSLHGIIFPLSSWQSTNITVKINVLQQHHSVRQWKWGLCVGNVIHNVGYQMSFNSRVFTQSVRILQYGKNPSDSYKNHWKWPLWNEGVGFSLYRLSIAFTKPPLPLVPIITLTNLSVAVTAKTWMGNEKDRLGHCHVHETGKILGP